MKIYLAGPLFSTAERAFNGRPAGVVREMNIEVWLPQESEQGAMSPRQIFEEDVRGIDWADVVVANMDGADPDSGTCSECGTPTVRNPSLYSGPTFAWAMRAGMTRIPQKRRTKRRTI
jgi:nucleoside 2-deoxyribosyltransferase